MVHIPSSSSRSSQTNPEEIPNLLRAAQAQQEAIAKAQAQLWARGCGCF